MNVAYKSVTAEEIRSLAEGMLKSAAELQKAAIELEKSGVKEIDVHWTTVADTYGPITRRFCQKVSDGVRRQIEDKREGRKTAEQYEKERVAKRKKNNPGKGVLSAKGK